MFMSHFNNVDRQTIDTYTAADMHMTLTADNARMLCWKTVLSHTKRLLKKFFRFLKFPLSKTVVSQIGQFYEKHGMDLKQLQCDSKQEEERMSAIVKVV